MLKSAREHEENNDSHCQGYDEGIGKAAEIVEHIEHKRTSYYNTHKYGEEQRQMVDTAFRPQSLELVAMVLLHNHGTQERGYEEHGK